MHTQPVPTSDIDLFSDAVLVDPWESYRELRDLGPVVHMTRWNHWAVMRYADVLRVLSDWKTFPSYDVALNPEMNHAIAQSGYNVLWASPPDHTTLRAVMSNDLAPRALRAKTEGMIQERAKALVDELVERGEFDAVRDLARPYVLNLICDLNGLPASGRDNFIDWASAAFETLGPMNDRYREALPKRQGMHDWLVREAGPDQVRPGSWARTVYDAVERGEVTARVGIDLVGSYIAPALDTTIQALGWMLHLFGTHPAQWELLQSNRELVPSAFREVLRIQTPVHSFGRSVAQEVEIDGVTVPAGSHLMISFASANRDERHWPDADAFDITRDSRRQLAFGHGVHACVGQGVAKLEGEAILSALLDRVESFEIGPSEPFVNNTVHGLSSLPVRITRTIA